MGLPDVNLTMRKKREKEEEEEGKGREPWRQDQAVLGL